MFSISLIIFILFSKALLTERHISKGVRFMGKRDKGFQFSGTQSGKEEHTYIWHFAYAASFASSIYYHSSVTIETETGSNWRRKLYCRQTVEKIVLFYIPSLYCMVPAATSLSASILNISFPKKVQYLAVH